MSARITFSLALAASLMASGCGRRVDERHYTLQGQVIAVSANRLEAEINHEEIKGFMPAMTMVYKVRAAALLDGIAPGDLITATLNVTPNDAYLSQLRKVGQAPLAAAPLASSPPGTLAPGDAAPDAALVDQDGRRVQFGSLKGSMVLLTFIYTRCPLPEFCPLMDRQFASIQRSVKGDPALAGRVRLVTVSFDPVFDTPAVLSAHARALDADLRTWMFVTGDREEIDGFAARFGVSVVRAPDDPDNITHNLRTALIGADGAILKIYSGNDWTPAQVVADLKAVAPTS